jgi:hypothetical protein
MKPLIELSTEQYGALLKGAAETSPLHKEWREDSRRDHCHFV